MGRSRTLGSYDESGASALFSRYRVLVPPQLRPQVARLLVGQRRRAHHENPGMIAQRKQDIAYFVAYANRQGPKLAKHIAYLILSG